MSVNAHRVFENGSIYGSYHSSICVARAQEDELRSARDIVRGALTEGLRNWQPHVSSDQLFEVALGALDPPTLRPKFRMQGSASYRTQVEPAHMPPQEIDLDDGLFLPVSFLTTNGRTHPVVASRGLFKAVESILAPVCDEHGWTLVTDKASCVRVEVSDITHVDVAMYAIPDEQFALLMEEVAKSGTVGTMQLWDSTEFADALYRGIDPDHIMLAHRDEGWKPSDPRKLDDWFQAAIRRHGPQLRRVCKYLKGWRDYQWTSCRLSSIALMAAVVAAYDAAPNEFDEKRDDLALLRVVRSLPAFLANRIDNPVVVGQRLDEGWSTDARNDYVSRASNLATGLFQAILRSGSEALTLRALAEQFGDRVPTSEALVDVEVAIGGEFVPAAPAVRIPSDEQARLAAAAVVETKTRGESSQPWEEIE